MTNITNEQLEAWAGLGPWLKQYSPTIDAMQIVETVECDLEGNVPIPRKIAHVYEGQRMDMDRIKLHSDALAAAPALARALLAERKAREVEVGHLTTSIDTALDWAGAKLADLITACDAALDWADANARWFDISTAPTKNGVGFHAISYDREGVLAYHVIRHEDEYFFVDLDPCDITEFSHWRPLPPPPSNPPLPEPLERLGEVLRRIKGA